MSEQQFWDAVFLAALPSKVEIYGRDNSSAVEYASTVADLAVVARRRRQEEVKP